jgi:tetratricopeptide (TPR) repeat protein
MNVGDTAAWEGDWGKAVEAYMAAVREFPGSTHAINSLGYALFQTNRMEDALKVYSRAHELDRDDPLPVERMADVLEHMGRVKDAAQQYIAVAEIYLAQHDIEKAIHNWERATQITPGLVKVQQKLAMAYERIGSKNHAINTYLQLAVTYQQGGRDDFAMKVLERANRLDPKNARVLNAMTAVRASRPIPPELVQTVVADRAEDESDNLFDFDPTVVQTNERGPIGEGVDRALEALANEVFESGMMNVAGTHAIQAIELHRAGIWEDASEAYRQAVKAGMKSAALLFNLGAVLVELKQWQEAIGILEQISGAESVIRAGASHALSLCYIEQRQWREAAKRFINTLRLVDLSLALDEDEANELTNVYSWAMDLAGQDDEQTLEDFSRSMAALLVGADWKQRIVQIRVRLEGKMKEGDAHALGDIAKGDRVIDAMTQVDTFAAMGRYGLAMDEALHIIEREPDYLAAHLRVAQLLMQQSHVEQAIQKYNLIARTYLLRGDEHKAADILNEVIHIAPADVTLRQNLIELLRQQNRMDEVLEQYIELGDTYRELADLTNASGTYREALQFAESISAPPEKMVQIMHGLGEVNIERFELRGALQNFQRIVELKSDDEAAHRRLVDLYYRMNNPLQAIKQLDMLLQIYARQRRPDMILRVLEQQCEEHPEDMGLRSRLGGVYQQMGRIENAVEQYETLRQLQYNAGMRDEAKMTIRRIISLNPPRVEKYQELLQQMGG